MKKKTSCALLVASCIALSATFTGCSLVSSNTKEDMAQVIAEVDITQSEDFESSGLKSYASAIGTEEINKLELVSYFINVGYSYVSNGSTYEDTFEMLVDSLVENAIITQYATLELLKDKIEKGESDALQTFTGKDSEIEKYEYLLGGEDSDDVKIAKYALYSSLNSALDSYESTLIDEEDEYTGTDSRTVPTNVDTEVDDYYPANVDGSLNYGVYTGYTGYLLKDSGEYQDDKVEGTTRSTRVRAYNSFLVYLDTNGLIDKEDESNLTDLYSLSYVKDEYLTQLKAQVVSVYADLYEEQLLNELVDGDYTYIQNIYEELLGSQEASYSDYTSFETALSSMSSTSFVLYSPDTSDSDLFDGENAGRFGFVYNILLPFSESQSRQLTALSSIYELSNDANAYYTGRNALLKGITTTDQRSAWFNGTTDYSFSASEAGITEYYGSSDYLFFENNLTKTDRYETLQAYDGRYAYNGKVYENEDGSYTLIPNKLSIDAMLDEFCAYVDYVLGYNAASYNSTMASDYYNVSDFYKYDEHGEPVLDDDSEKEIDYSYFVYTVGKITESDGSAIDFSHSDLFNPATTQYKAMSAVNELQYAYTTDTSVLSNYVGYSVSAYDTSYIEEFEYAAKLAINDGVGTFVVCAGDYGWHIIYVTCVYDIGGGNVYDPDWAANIETEGTFENLFYEWIKDSNISDLSSNNQSRIISLYNTDDVVTLYESRYKDLLELDS